MKENRTVDSASVKEASAWRRIVQKYETPEVFRSAWQLVNTLVPYIFLWWLMFLSLDVSYWLTLALSLPAAGLLVRIFVINHDCGHRSFFKRVGTNNLWGSLTGTIALVPFAYWRRDHAQHHASSGNLDRRGVGDIWTLTVEEYLDLPRWRRLFYRLYRNPVVMFLVGPVFVFLVLYRVGDLKSPKADLASIWKTNLALALIVGVAAWLIGIKAFFLVQAPIAYFAAVAGVWLFYVQHQFEGVYWERTKNWDFLSQALQGSSYYHLPPLLQWFTGSIGFHHIHHLSPRIPNYLLGKCHSENELFQKAKKINLLQSLELVRYKLWDEKGQKLVTFSELRSMLRKRALV